VLREVGRGLPVVPLELAVTHISTASPYVARDAVRA
jgi:hypothetical protein